MNCFSNLLIKVDYFISFGKMSIKEFKVFNIVIMFSYIILQFVFYCCILHYFTAAVIMYAVVKDRQWSSAVCNVNSCNISF